MKNPFLYLLYAHEEATSYHDLRLRKHHVGDARSHQAVSGALCNPRYVTFADIPKNIYKLPL